MDRALLAYALLPIPPLLAGAVVPLLARFTPEASARWAQAAVLVPLFALAAAHALPLLSGTPGAEPALGLEFMSTLLAVMVSLIALAVLRFGRRYLDGDPTLPLFCALASALVSAVLTMLVAGNLIALAIGWIATGALLRRLLLLRTDRPGARRAADAQFRAAVVGDSSLLLAAIYAIAVAGSAGLPEVFEAAATRPAFAIPMAVLLALAAMAMSAQLPFHTWLPDSMETPTPVSALLHAGVVNAGGVLLIRMSPLMREAPVVLAALAFVGALSASVAAVVMLAQTDIKRKLAYSTLAQMGFMLMQCGLGAFGAAALHLVGHSFYKAYAFLSSGAHAGPKPTPVELDGRPAPQVGLATALASVGAGVAIVFGACWALGVEPATKAGAPVLISVLAIGLGQILSSAHGVGGAPLRRTLESLLLGGLIAGAYFAGVGFLDAQIGAPGPVATTSPLATTVAWTLSLFFLASFALQTLLPRHAERPLLQKLYVHARNGFYLGPIFQSLFERRRSAPLATSLRGE
ncbi:MAG: proton-conducting transporter membrane subunit [Myxococcota bacterium]